MKKQQINCNVFNCKHCDNKKCFCKLESIKVCNCDKDRNKKSTMCDSFEKENN